MKHKTRAVLQAVAQINLRSTNKLVEVYLHCKYVCLIHTSEAEGLIFAFTLWVWSLQVLPMLWRFPPGNLVSSPSSKKCDLV